MPGLNGDAGIVDLLAFIYKGLFTLSSKIQTTMTSSKLAFIT